MMTDPIADMLTRIRNANSKGHKTVEVPFSSVKARIGQVLLDEGFISGISESTDGRFKNLVFTLKYEGKAKAINGLERISKPGLRIYVGKENLPRVLGGLGISIVSTPKGIVAGKKAKDLGVGGELICKVW
jgi:small subunit ribosomal protein S8